MHKKLITTGYMGSGSSAFTDFFSEFKEFQNNSGSFEFIFLHCPNGLFDLEDKLLLNNNAIRSDEALFAFRSEMRDLFRKFNWWPGNYRTKVSPKFMEIVDTFVGSLTTSKSDSYWYYQQKLNGIQNLKSIILYVINIISSGKTSKTVLNRKPMLLSIPSSDEFYEKSRHFLNDFFAELGGNKHSLLIDQLLLPHNLWRFNNYFDSNTYCVVVSRDPRDVFLSNKYIWAPQGQPVPFPFEVEDFCDYYRRMRESVKPFSNKNIVELNFEDLIYDYDKTERRLCDLIGIDQSTHTLKKKHFDASKSINNTQLFNSDQFKAEADIIEAKLSNYLYPFPYKRETNTSIVF